MIKVLKAVGMAVAAAPFAMIGMIAAGPAGVAVTATLASIIIGMELID